MDAEEGAGQDGRYEERHGRIGQVRRGASRSGVIGAASAESMVAQWSDGIGKARLVSSGAASVDRKGMYVLERSGRKSVGRLRFGMGSAGEDREA